MTSVLKPIVPMMPKPLKMLSSPRSASIDPGGPRRVEHCAICGRYQPSHTCADFVRRGEPGNVLHKVLRVLEVLPLQVGVLLPLWRKQEVTPLTVAQSRGSKRGLLLSEVSYAARTHVAMAMRRKQEVTPSTVAQSYGGMRGPLLSEVGYALWIVRPQPPPIPVFTRKYRSSSRPSLGQL